MKHHLWVIQSLLDKNNLLEAQAYIKRLLDVNNFEQSEIISSGNFVMDALINGKYMLMKKADIVFYFDVHIPDILPFENADICVLFGNLMDNAIEAAKKVSRKQRYVKLYVLFDKRNLIITLKNSFDGTLQFNGSGDMRTTKPDAANHGTGIQSARGIVNKYHGSILMEHTDTEFTTKALLMVYH